LRRRRGVMLDAARIIALLVACSACVRPRYLFGVAIVVLLLLVDGVAMVAPLLNRAASPANAGYAFVLVYWGPSGMPMPPSTSFLVRLVGDHPVVRVAMTAALAWAATILAFERSRPLRPESDRARAWDRVGLRFLLVAVLDSLLVVVGLLLARLMTAGA